MKRILKSNGKLTILEIDPTTGNGKRLKVCESILHTRPKFYEPFQLRRRSKTPVKSTSLGYFLTAIKGIQK